MALEEFEQLIALRELELAELEAVKNHSRLFNTAQNSLEGYFIE